MTTKLLYTNIISALLLILCGIGNLYSQNIEAIVQQRSQQRLDELSRIKNPIKNSNTPLMRTASMSATEPFEGYFSIMFQENELNITKTITIDWDYDFFTYYDYIVGAEFSVFYKAPSNLDYGARPIAHITTSYSDPLGFVCLHNNDVPITEVSPSASCEFSLYMGEDYDFNNIDAHWISTFLTPMPNSYLGTKFDHLNPNLAESDYRKMTKNALKTSGKITVSVTLTKQEVAPPDQKSPLPTAPAFSSNQNYINTRTYTSADEKYYLDNVQYFDGLGRPNQQIQRESSVGRKDIVTLREYDAYGRESNVWLPAVVNSPKGTYVSESTIKSNSISSNGGDTKPYSTPIYESSPLNRVVEQYGPGQAWHQDYSLAKGKAIRTYYMTNKGGSKIARPTIDLADNRTLSGAYGACQTITLKDKFHFKADDEKSLHLYIDPSLCQVATPMAINTTNAPASTLRDEFLQCTIYKVGTNAVIKSDDYKTGELYVTLIIDEDGNQSLEFKDKLGQVVLTRQVNGSEKYDTYYVYDDFGYLRYVLPPLAVDRLTNFTDEDPIMQQFAYIYKYDHRNRCIWKKLPGAKHILYVYDKADQLIFTQDGEQRNRKTNGRSEWTFNKYDAFGRLIISGIYQTADTLEALATKYEKIVVKENVGSGSYGYTWYHLTESEIDIKKHVLLVNYYDNYNNFPKMWDYPQVLVYKNEQDYGTKYNNAKGLLIGTRVKHFKPTGETEYSRAGETATTYFYDNRGRVIQTHSTNHLGGTDSEYIAYNFTGQPIKKKHVHTANNSTQTEVYDYTYDHALRLTETKHNGTVIAFNTYDELGRLISNKKGNNAYLDTKYNYNIRSWTTSMKSSHLHINLDYTYGGNIKFQAWAQEAKTRKYDFEYDGLSRLLSAKYISPISGEKYGTAYTYDKHGNIASIKREGKTGTNTYGLVDDLTMTYLGNQLVKVKDEINTTSIAGSADFINYGGANAQMSYNLNGALAKDMHKGISSIQYNSLNLPQSMVIDNGQNARGNIAYTYTASGVKLQTIHTEDENIANMPIMGTGTFASVNPKVTTTDYVGNKIYEKVGNDARKLKRILIDGGYIEGGAYHYYLTDHLGNNRAVANAGGNIIQRTQYYPFGMAFTDKQNEELQPYKYNGKELDTRLQLNTYDYSARYMDPAIGRFTSIDPLAEKYYSWSPYAYVANNPLKYVDYRGDSISVSQIQQYDTNNGTNYLTSIINDLQSQTGLTYSVSSTGMLVYNKDTEGNAVVTKDSNGDSTGSETARGLMTDAIGHTETTNVQIIHHRGSVGERGGLAMGLNPTQIEGFINGANNLDGKTLGWGMTFMHELSHTKLGGGLADEPYSKTFGITNPGPVATRMNTIRSELNALGGNYGQRMTYPAYPVGGSLYMPFDVGSRTAVMYGGVVPTSRLHKYIKR